MKKVYIVNIVWVSLIIVFVIFYKIMSAEFAKIENEVVDKYDEKVIVTYTTKNDIEKLYINKLQVHTNIINCTQLNHRLSVYLLNVKNKYNKVK